MHRCERNKMKQFAAFRCKMRQISAEQDEANRSRLKRFAGVCRRPEEIKRQGWLLYDGPDWCWLTPERFLCIPVWSICGPAGPVNGAATWGHRRAFRSVSKHFEIECIARRGLLVVASRSILLRFDADCTLIEDQQLDARDGGLGRVVQGRFPEGPEGGRGPVRLGRQETGPLLAPAHVRDHEDFGGGLGLPAGGQHGGLGRDARGFLWQEANERPKDGDRGDKVQGTVIRRWQQNQ
jgi:hypothetical protein